VFGDDTANELIKAVAWSSWISVLRRRNHHNLLALDQWQLLPDGH
jgi:hypothetical protein